jgi:hypothetical protein
VKTPATAKPYADPYVAGASLGAVLLASFVVAGRGLGASGAFTSVAAGLACAARPSFAHASALFGPYLAGEGPWREWLLFEVAGIAVGAFASAKLAGRVRREVERGAGVSSRGRLVSAFAGGAAMGIGAAMARGCTSGLALSGGALLGVGSWLFMGAAFAAAYLVAPLVRGAWR